MTYPGILPDGIRPFYPVAVPASAVQEPFALGGVLLIGGWSFVETTGAAPAKLELWDGGESGGECIAVINLAAGEAKTTPAPAPGIGLRSHLIINVTQGSVRGSVWAVNA